VVALRRTGSAVLRVANVAPKYALVEFAAQPTQEVDLSQRSWATYFLCGYKGVHDYLAARGQADPADGGLDIMVDGRVPTGSGLSSSSALVCASALAVMASKGAQASFAPSSHCAHCCHTCARLVVPQG